MSVRADILPDLHKKFEKPSIYETNIEYEIKVSSMTCLGVMLTHAHTHTDQLIFETMWFQSGEIKKGKSIRISILKI